MNNESVRYKRGSVWYCNLDSNMQGVQSGFRPVLIISNDIGNVSGSQVNVLAITSKDKGNYSVNVKFKNHKNEDNVILCNQVFTVNHDKLKDYQYQVSNDIMNKVEDSFTRAMGISTFQSSIDKFDEVIQKIVDAKTRLAEQNLSKITEDRLLHMASVLEDLFKDTLSMSVKSNKDSIELNAPIISSYVNAAEDNKNNEDNNADLDNSLDLSNKQTKRKPHGFWTADKMKEFIHDKETMKLSDVREKWKIEDNKKVIQTYYSLKNKMNKLGII